MRPFLESFADYIIGEYASGMDGLCFVFPNRRSGLFFKQYLTTKSIKTTWMPEITAINEFICNLSTLEPADPIEVLFELYDIYKTTIPEPEPFDEFYYWGEIMINDFDDIDKYLVNADQVFRNISDLKEIDNLFGSLEEEQIRFIRQFWDNFHQGELSGEKREFLNLWKMLPGLYEKLRENLEIQGVGYEGMIYRKVAEQFLEETVERIDYTQVYFVGFNALSSSEKKIFQHLKNSGTAYFYWDYDQRYINETYWEAGKFIRQNLELFKPDNQLEEFDNLRGSKELRIFDLPNDVLQAKTLSTLLKENKDANFQDHTDTAVVLCDEELLVPVLMSLPEDVEDVNITMGYPFKTTPAFSFIDQLLNLQRNLQMQEQEGFYYKDVLGIINHPFVKSISVIGESDLSGSIIKNNLIYISGQDISGKLEKSIFRKINSAEGFQTYFNEIVELILSGLDGSDEDFQASLNREYLFQFMLTLNRISGLLINREEIDVPMFIRIFRKAVVQLRIPFTGEPLAGLQVMGILETRLLDFRNLVLLSMNEEIMPRGQSAQSLIPYTLRTGYNLPTREDKDAIYAYYFYRLIQRAKHVDLIYNSGSEGVKSGEMSRYLYQLKFEHNLETIRPVLDIKSIKSHKIVINKDKKTMDWLNKFSNPDTDDYLSPSALNTLIDCSLRYYLRYIAGIGEPAEVTEVVSAADFGTILHETIKVLYEEIRDPESFQVNEASLHILLKSHRPADVLKETFEKVFFKGKKPKELSGRNIIIFSVLLKYIRKIIDRDIEIAPFRLESLEKFYPGTLKIDTPKGERDVKVGGKIDRIDRVEGRLRVIDYKTGTAELKFGSVEDLFDISLKSRNRAGFQTLLYGWLVGRKFKDEKILPGLYVMKNLFSEDFNPAFSVGPGRQKIKLDSFNDVEEEYISNLSEVLLKLYDETVPFSQTENSDLCKFCDYRQICRNTQFD